MTSAVDIDPARLKILWERLSAATDEAGTALRRSAFSSVIRESRDFSYSLFDRRARPLAQSTESIPSFMGTLPRTLGHLLEKFPVGEWGEGDVAITNDPWLGTGHLPDICLARPIFRHGQVVGFAGAVGHVSDIGGTGLSASARELFHEGLIIPPMWAYKGEVPLPLVTELIAANVRIPGEVLGDIEALVVGCRVLEKRVQRILTEADGHNLEEIADALDLRSEAAMRKVIGELPIDSPVQNEILMDGQDGPLTIRVTLEKRGTDLTLDFSGTSAQVGYGINSVLSYTRAYSLYAIKCALGPTLPNNDGAFAAIDVTAEPGSLVNPEAPAPVGGRNMTGHFVAQAVLGALGKVIPERVLAESGAPRPVLSMRGHNLQGEPFSTVFFLMGGMGAGATHDGLSVTAFPTNTSFTPVEIIEQTTPVRIVNKSLRENSGGAGEYRGGLGQSIQLKLIGTHPAEVALIGNRGDYPPQGLAGGRPGAVCLAYLNGRRIGLMETVMLAPGDVIRVDTPGGGGYGKPDERDPTAVQADQLHGLTCASPAKAATEPAIY